MKGWIPSSRFVSKDTAIVAFGSCFASNISNYLHGRGYNVLNRGNNDAYVTKIGDGMVNTHAILQQFLWAWENVAPQASVWHGKKAEDFEQEEGVRLTTKALFDAADLFIITLGLSELWYDEPTGEVFWRAVPADAYDPQRHKFRTATHSETLHNLEKIYSLIKTHRPNAHILFSVSPIPLTATFRPISCLTADAVSKATIRSALDEFLQAHSDNKSLHYFPSYEAVKRIFHYQWGEDRRHVRRDVLDFNMKMFEHYYCDPGLEENELRAAYDHAWELDINRAENVRGRDRIFYEEKRAQTKKAKIDARIAARAELRRQEQQRVLAEKLEKRKQSTLLAFIDRTNAAFAWIYKYLRKRLGHTASVVLFWIFRAAVVLLALDSLTGWISLIGE
ncbi:GSCFA family protein [Xaviernesmea oryzae]|nr:GSCFA family protein [Xaviernesmea oryzae]